MHDRGGAADTRRPLSHRVPILVFLGLAGLLFGLLALQVMQARDGQDTFADELAQAYAQAFAEHASRSFEAVDLVLGNVAGRMERATTWPDPLAIHRTLHDRKQAGLPQVRDLMVFDRDGAPVARALVHPASTVVAPTLMAPLRDEGQTSTVSPLFYEGNTRSATFAVARRLTRPDGSFAGMAGATIEPAYFRDLFKVIAVLPGTKVALMSKDGVLVAWPADATQGASAGTPAHGGGHEAMAMRPVEGQPLHLMVSVPAHAAMAKWRHHIRDMGFATVVVVAVLLIATVIVVRHVRREAVAVGALRQAVAKFSTLASCSGEWFWEADAAGHLTYLSDRFRAAVGQPVETVLGKELAELADPELSASALAEIGGALAAARPFRNIEWAVRQPDGVIRWIRTSGMPHLNESGDVVGYRGTSSDITAERALAAHDIQRQRIESLGQLASGIAHELNNLLHPMINFAYFARDRVEDATTRQYLDTVCESGLRAREIVRGVLTFARQEAQERRPTVFADALRDALDLAAGILPASLRIVRHLPRLPHRAMVNETEVAQLVVNLLTNARDATEGGGTVTVSLEPAEATRGVPPGPTLRLVVTDDGCGMNEVTVARAFDPFFTTKPPGVGTGLGLSVVYGIVRSWDGTIILDSRVGAGTTFTIHVPVQPGG